jgi:hypothetical protein
MKKIFILISAMMFLSSSAYDVFVAWADNVGYNTLGQNIEENDFPNCEYSA